MLIAEVISYLEDAKNESSINTFFFTGLISIYSISCALSKTVKNKTIIIVSDSFLDHISTFGGKNWVPSKSMENEELNVAGTLFGAKVITSNCVQKKNFIIASTNEDGCIEAAKYQTSKGHQ